MAACRRLDPTLGWDGVGDSMPISSWGHQPPRIDGRIVAAGYGHVPPREWVRGERRDGRSPCTLEAFVSYWDASVERPETVGSDRNDLSPERAYALWRAGVPSRVALALGRRLLRRDGGVRHLSRSHLAWAARAAARASVASVVGGPQPSLRLLAALGRLCPELQGVALDSLPRELRGRDGQPRMARLGDVDWERVSQAQRDLLAGGERVRVAYATRMAQRRTETVLCRRAQHLAVAVLGVGAAEPEIAAWLCPAYPSTSVEQAARLCRGETPEQVSGGVLTRSEAHRWLLEAPAMAPLAWLTRALPGVPPLRSAAVARWLLDVRRRGGWGGLTRERTMHGPAGGAATVRYIDRIDEIQDEDLVRRIRTSVDEAFRSAEERAGGAWLDGARGDHRVLAPPPPWRMYPCMRLLDTPARLAREGQDMGHCVAGYASAVERGQSVILALDVRGHRSTVELSPAGDVYQHRGPRNEVPHPWCEMVLGRFLRRNRGAQRRVA